MSRSRKDGMPRSPEALRHQTPAWYNRGMTTFAEAREAALVPTLPEGLEDDRYFVVALAEPPVDDTIVLVEKSSGVAFVAARWEYQDRLARMTPVK